MIRLAPLAFAGLLAACATDSGAEPPPSVPGGEGCDVSVSFGSYAMGIDQEAYGRVDAWLKANPKLVADVKVTPWGREGERTLCVTTTSPAAIRPVFSGVVKLLPVEGRKAPITALSKTGGHFHTRGGPGG
ncbi:MAG TPA: hypothetical protein VEA44_04530 [Caulobacter sp.]|nr:hypothetical protein [Caulobacter sp.]